MKLTGMAGVGSGKLGSQVYSAIGNTQIVRNYQPKVANPNTTLQVNVRARFKLLSQLSAAMSPVLAFKHNRLVSARNRFVKKNYDLTSGNDGLAQLTLENLQITGGSAGLPGIHATRLEEDKLQLELVANAGAIVSRVVYCIFRKTSASSLQFIRSIIVDGPTVNGIFRTITDDVTGDLVLYAYGMFDLSNNASAKYGALMVRDGQDIARLVMNRTLSFSQYRFTRTRGCQLYADETETRSVGINEVRVFVTPSGNGNVEGNGIYERNDQIILEAQPNENNTFIGWIRNGGTDFVAYTPTLVLKATSMVDLVAVFQNPDSSTGGYNGQELTNPLPLDSAIVEIDDLVVDIRSGIYNYYMDFDWIYISGIEQGHEFMYVPYGSFLGNDDNVSLQYNQGKYGFQQSGTSSGYIYYDGLLMFFINCVPWINKYPDAELWLDGIQKEVNSPVIQVSNYPDYIRIQQLGSEHVVTAYYNGENVPFHFYDNEWINEDTGPDLPLQINIDDEQWIIIKLSE